MPVRPMRHSLGVEYPFIFADATGEHAIASPVQDLSMPMFFGQTVSGKPPAEGGVFRHEGAVWRCRDLLEVGHPLNPFPVTLVMGELV